MALIIKNGVSGRGVFTDQPISPREFIVQFTGPLLTHAQTTPRTLALQIAPDLYMGASGGADDFINHSCRPNCGLVIKGNDVRLLALREIRAGEEIFFDYSTTMDEDDFEMACHCGQPHCRKLIRDFKHLPIELKRYYVEMGIVPDYNCKYLIPRTSNSVG